MEFGGVRLMFFCVSTQSLSWLYIFQDLHPYIQYSVCVCMCACAQSLIWLYIFQNFHPYTLYIYMYIYIHSVCVCDTHTEKERERRERQRDKERGRDVFSYLDCRVLKERHQRFPPIFTRILLSPFLNMHQEIIHRYL